jgi:hypothetical protein
MRDLNHPVLVGAENINKGADEWHSRPVSQDMQLFNMILDMFAGASGLSYNLSKTCNPL